LVGVKNTKYPILKETMNNLDRIYNKDPIAFAQSYFEYLNKVLSKIDREEIGRFVNTLIDARERGATVFFIGNGGSAATASHFANDIAIGTNSYQKPFRVISLTDNQAILTAIGNDFGYNEIFTRQLKVLAKSGDVLVGISASGNSPNLLEAFQYAKLNKIKTVAITAFDGGKLLPLRDEGVHVPTELKEYGPAEDAHMVLDHLIGSYLIRWIQNEK
jgi:D-sedoheptulose 7-phosphate isomerase